MQRIKPYTSATMIFFVVNEDFAYEAWEAGIFSSYCTDSDIINNFYLNKIN